MDPALARRAEEFWVAASREQYEALAGLNPRPELAAIYDRYGDLLDRDRVAALAEAERAATGHAQRRLRHLREFLVSSRAERAQGRLLDERLAWEATTVLEAAGARIPFRQASAALANAAEREERWLLEDARLAALREIEGLDRERFRREWEVYAEAGGAGYLASWEALSGIALAPLVEAAHRLLDETADLFHELLAHELPRRLGVEPGEARAADRLRLERAPWYDAHFGVADPVAVARRQLGELGFDLEAGGRIRLDLEARPTKWARPFCAVIRVPAEVVLVLSASGGWRDWFAFYHEIGHAQHLARVDAALPFEERVLGDISVTEGYARLFEQLTAEPLWLERYLGLRGEVAVGFQRLATLLDLLRLRRQAGKLLYEIELHSSGRFDGMAERYAEQLTEATSLRHDPAAYLDDVDPHLYCARYLRSWALEAQLAETLRRRFDEDWFRNPRSGPFLAELFALGQSEDGEGIARRLGADGLPFDRVTRRLEERVG